MVKNFRNNKPWEKKDLKQIINEKKWSLRSDRDQVRVIQKRLESKISSTKNEFKVKGGQQFRYHNLRNAWKGLELLCSYKKNPKMSEPNTAILC